MIQVTNSVAKDAWVYSGGWRNAVQIYVRSGNAWYPTWVYQREITAWSTCSEICNRNNSYHTRTVRCFRYYNGSNRIEVDNAYCNADVKYNSRTQVADHSTTTPPTWERCNTHLSCTIPVYVYTSYDDQHYAGFYLKSGDFWYIINVTSGWKHNDMFTYNGTINFAREEFPLKFKMGGWNVSNGGGPRPVNVAGESLIGSMGNWGASITIEVEVSLYDNTNTPYVSGKWGVGSEPQPGFNWGWLPW